MSGRDEIDDRDLKSFPLLETNVESEDGSVRGETFLPAQHPHRPSGYQHAAEKHDETVHAIFDHLTRGVLVRDAEDDGCEDREDQRGAEVIERDVHCFFPMAM